MLPFGQTVLAWRLERGLSQEELAQGAHLPRPNLSAIERGAREVSLKTLRSLALALQIKPGVLADGEGPPTQANWSREALERIAMAIVRGKELRDLREATLAVHVGNMMRSHLHAQGIVVPRLRRIGRSASHAWLRSTQYPPEVIRSLIERVREKAALRVQAI